MWKRFNEDAKKCMIEATKIAVRLGRPTVSLAHLFLAVVDYVKANKAGREDLEYMYEVCVSQLEDCAIPLREAVQSAIENAASAEGGPITRGEARFCDDLKSIMRPLLINNDELITCEVLFSAAIFKLLGGPLSGKEDEDRELARALALSGKSFSVWQPDGKECRVVCSVESEMVGFSKRDSDGEGEDEESLREMLRDRRESVQRRSEERRRSLRRNSIREFEDFGVELVAAAAKGQLDPVVARDGVIEEVIVKLLKYKKNNPLLIGEPGVGKTAIIDGVAQRIADHQVPKELEDVRILSLDIGKLTAGTRYRGDFEERFKRLLKAVLESDGKVIIFIDEIHTIIGAGSSENGLDAANMLKPVLTDSRFRCIGATTQAEYSKKFEKDHALDRRFLRIMVDEPNFNQACTMIDGLRQRYADFHKVIISDEVIELAVRLASRYITDRCLPDKAIDLIDEAASRARVEKALAAMPGEALKEAPKRGRRKKKDAEGESPAEAAPMELTKEHVAQVISLRVGVPVTKLTESDQERLLNVQEILHKRLVGQDEPIRLVSEAIWRARAGNRDSKRPIGAFLFLGPTGVGKTELAKALAEYLFYDESALVRIDMSEYGERYSVSRLLGASPGYVGYEEGGQLDILRHKPYAVVLFDEVEKAHPDIFGSLLQIMDEGSLTDAQGRHIDFKNTLIILTSNLGFGEQEEKSFGFRTSRNEEDAETRYRIMQNKVTEAMKDYFKPEFLNRLDAAVVFHSLEPEHLKKIIDIMVGYLNEELAVEGRELTLTEAAKERIVNSCNEPQYGARPLRRALRDWVETPMAKQILSARFPENSRMKVDIDKKDESKLRFVPLKSRSGKAKKSGVAAWNAKEK